MLRNLVIIILLYLGYTFVRRWLSKNTRRSASRGASSPHRQPREHDHPGAVDAEFEELDDRDS
jgi:hypothetical protein